jgi:hypothetical protein
LSASSSQYQSIKKRETYSSSEIISIVEMRSKELGPGSEIPTRIRVNAIRRDPFVGRQVIVVFVSVIQAVPVVRQRLAQHICGRVGAHAGTGEGVDVWEKLFERINRQKRLSTNILLEVDNDFLKASSFTPRNEFPNRALKGVDSIAVFVKTGNTEYGDGCGVEEIACLYIS